MVDSSNFPKLLAALDMPIVGKQDNPIFADSFTEASQTSESKNDVAKYIRVPAMAPILAVEKNAEMKTTNPKSDMPYTQKNKKTKPLLEYLTTLIESKIVQSIAMTVTTKK